jgi:phosphoenolpyruvate carboxylase
MLLQKQFDMTDAKMMRVVPLFETLDDLNNAPDVVNTLWSIPGYLESVGHKVREPNFCFAYCFALILPLLTLNF